MKTAFNCLFLITGFKLLKLLSVVCGFGWQTFICKNYMQNICSVHSIFERMSFKEWKIIAYTCIFFPYVLSHQIPFWPQKIIKLLKKIYMLFLCLIQLFFNLLWTKKCVVYVGKFKNF